MVINYIILAHQNPHQLKRLVKRLSHQNSYFFVHIDKAVDQKVFRETLQPNTRVKFLTNNSRKLGTWGDIEIVKGTIEALKLIDFSEGYTVLLSGQDYPLRKPEEIHKFFEREKGKHFIETSGFENTWGYLGQRRIKEYKIQFTHQRGDYLLLPSLYSRNFYTKKSLKNIYTVLRKTGIHPLFHVLKKRRFPKDLKPYGGSAYWAIPNDTIKKVMAYIRAHPEYLQFHTHTLSADEIFFHSIIMKIREQNPMDIAPSITYANWSSNISPLPVTFKRSDLTEMIDVSSKYLFARKFDESTDADILNLIDERLLT